MMSQPIFDMHAVAAQQVFEADASEGFLDKLIDGLMSLPQTDAEEILDRADSYGESQPSFAEDLRAAVA